MASSSYGFGDSVNAVSAKVPSGLAEAPQPQGERPTEMARPLIRRRAATASRMARQSRSRRDLSAAARSSASPRRSIGGTNIITMTIGNTAEASSQTINSVITIKAAATSMPFTSVSLSDDGNEQDERDGNGEGQGCRRRDGAHEWTDRGERALEAEQRHGEANSSDGDR